MAINVYKRENHINFHFPISFHTKMVRSRLNVNMIAKYFWDVDWNDTVFFSLSMIHCQVFGYMWLADCMYTETNFTSVLEMYKGWINTKCWVYFACCFGQLSAAGKVLICYRHANNPLFWLITVYGPASFKVIPRGRSKYA